MYVMGQTRTPSGVIDSGHCWVNCLSDVVALETHDADTTIWLMGELVAQLLLPLAA